MIIKENLKTLLQKKILQITFIKKDGNERVMQCSLREDLLPKLNTNVSSKHRQKKENSDVLAAWDLEKEAFRSFRLDSIKSYSALEEGYEL